MGRRSYGMVSLFVEYNGVRVVLLKLWQGEIEFLCIFRRFDSFRSPDNLLSIVSILWDILPNISTEEQSWISDAQEILLLLVTGESHCIPVYLCTETLSSCGVSFICNCEDALGIPHLWKRRPRHCSPQFFSDFVGLVAYLDMFCGKQPFLFCYCLRLSHFYQRAIIRTCGEKRNKNINVCKRAALCDTFCDICDLHILASWLLHVFLILMCPLFQQHWLFRTPCKAKTKDTLWTEIHRTSASMAAAKRGMVGIAVEVLDEWGDFFGTMWKFW